MFRLVTNTGPIIIQTNVIINITTGLTIIIITVHGLITIMAISSPGISKKIMVIITRTMIINAIKNVGAMDMISIVIVYMVDLTSNTGTSV